MAGHYRSQEFIRNLLLIARSCCHVLVSLFGLQGMNWYLRNASCPKSISQVLFRVTHWLHADVGCCYKAVKAQRIRLSKGARSLCLQLYNALLSLNHLVLLDLKLVVRCLKCFGQMVRGVLFVLNLWPDDSFSKERSRSI